MFLLSCGNSSKSSDQNYEESKMSLEDQERNNPLDFLSDEATYRKEIVGKEMVIEGTIHNKATIVTYKDVKFQVRYYSKTDSELGSDNYVILEFFPPNKKTEFRLKFDVPNGTKSLGWKIISAESK
jgi:hypothetical protein